MIYNIIIIGAGSVGLPLSYFLSTKGLSVLVIDKNPSPGQGENKAAIGGVRASHSEPVKILACKESINIYKSWEEEKKAEFDVKDGGYLYVCKNENDYKDFINSYNVLKNYNVKSYLLSKDELKNVVSDINSDIYYGGLYSPDDINVSPLKSAYAFYKNSLNNGVKFAFNESVIDFIIEKNKITTVITDKNKYKCDNLVLANGRFIRELGLKLNLEIPVFPDSHEGGISAPYEKYLGPMIVDISSDEPKISKNFYFTQNKEGSFIFCYTPYESIYGDYARSEFMQVIARRMIETLPTLSNVFIRRTWRGYYPNTPDGVPIADKIKDYDNLFIFGGMCGQGVMLGPGLAKNFANFIIGEPTEIPVDIFKRLSFYRDFSSAELLK